MFQLRENVLPGISCSGFHFKCLLSSTYHITLNSTVLLILSMFISDRDLQK